MAASGGRRLHECRGSGLLQGAVRGAPDARNDGAVAGDARRDVPVSVGACATGAVSRSKGKAEACSCDGECQTGFCVDGTCCTSACGEPCKACNLPSSLGDCAFVPAGRKPNDPADCVASTQATCGRDGTCDGKGGCRLYVKGLECKAGTCDGDGVTGIVSCDGNGKCSETSSRPCPPYSCDPATNQCARTCTTDAQCAVGQQCVAGSCGTKPIGAALRGERRLHLGLLRGRRVLQRRVQWPLRVVRPARLGGHLHVHLRGPARRRVQRPRSNHLRQHRPLRRLRLVHPVPGKHGVRLVFLRGLGPEHPADLRRQGHVPESPGRRLLALPLRERCLYPELREQRGLRERLPVPTADLWRRDHHGLWQKGKRAALPGRERVSVGPVCRPDVL